jgi:acyl-homoserine-lactone acylase
MKGSLFVTFGLVALTSANVAVAAGFDANIVWTHYGIPHVTASDYAGLGYGQAYAYARDNLCLLADRVITVRGERSKTFGADGTTVVAFTEVKNIDSDFFFKAFVDLPALKRGLAKASPENQDMVKGFAAGYNRYLRDTAPEKRPAACRSADWVKPISSDDVLRLGEDQMIQLSGSQFLTALATTSPPGTAMRGRVGRNFGIPRNTEALGFGSNAWAFGRDVTANGSGVLLGNPHYSWETTDRLYELQLAIPGKFEAMGVMLGGLPGIFLGFNHDIAWSHTVSTDRHFTFFKLALDPHDPTIYLVDGKPVRMQRNTISVEIVGQSRPETRTLYSSVYGPIVATSATPWTAAYAYAIRDADHNNTRFGDAWLAIARARSVREVQSALQRTEGMPYVNTIAADRGGEVLYADIDATPNVSTEKLKTCAPQKSSDETLGYEVEYEDLDSRPFFVLDGTRSSCNWDIVPDAASPGLMPPSAMPATVRTDYVANSNDSYWLVNPKAPLLGYSPILGATQILPRMRTRMGILAIEARLSGSDGLSGHQVDRNNVEAMLFANRNLAAELVLDDTAKVCATAPYATTRAGTNVDIRPACAILGKWDRRMNRKSVGGMLFVEFWKRASRIPGVWAVPFGPENPIHTPRGLNLDDAHVSQLAQALAETVDLMRSEHVSIDAPDGSVLFAVRGNAHIPLHGGDGSDGVLNALHSEFVPSEGGYVPDEGSSYIQVVSFDERGPVADAVLTYSQSTDPASPHFADQTRLFSDKNWVHLPFHATDVVTDAEGPPLHIVQ